MINGLPPAASMGSCFHLSGPAELWELEPQAAEDSGGKKEKINENREIHPTSSNV